MSSDPLEPIRGGRVLGVFAKQPLAGKVKTRLASASSPAWAAEVAAAFLQDLLERVSGINARRILAFAPDGAEAYFADLVQGRCQLARQHGGDLGQRMENFFAEAFRAGAPAVVLVGTDSPTVPTAYIEQAFTDLEQADAVLGPAMDGGYYLIGCGRPAPVLFQDVPWGTGRVLEDAIARLAGTSLRLALLPPWYDVDTIDDWQMLKGHLAALRRAGIDPGVPRVEQLMARGEAGRSPEGRG
jgi:rSAM/selenodomain-associated transferase 1